MQNLEQCLGYHFRDPHLLKQALTHRSKKAQHNERLEFLGDAILGFLIAEELYKRYPELDEGDLSRMRSGLVKREMLVELAQKLHLSEYVELGYGEAKSGGQHRASILADALEAVLGAIYLDSSDLRTCWNCLNRWYGEAFFTEVAEEKLVKDPKSSLQEWTQAKKYSLPVYQTTTSGKSHAQVFLVTCRVPELPYETTGKSLSRKQAEQQAAERFLALLMAECL